VKTSNRPQCGCHVGGDAGVDGGDGNKETDEEQGSRHADASRADTCRCRGNSDVIRRRDARTVEILLDEYI